MPVQPNLLVIISDQLQRATLGCYGGPVPTPHLDRLAAEAVRFDRCYCATPLCVPTRPSMMTGTWPHTHGATSFGQGYARIHCRTELLIDRLVDAGYGAGYDGIWHINRDPADEPRNGRFVYRPGGFPYQEHAAMFVAQGGEDGTQRASVRTPTDDGWHDWGFSLPTPAVWTSPLAEHPDRARADRVAAALRETSAERPFAWWCSFGTPHPPLLVPREYHGRFDPADLEPPPSFGQDMSGLPAAIAESPGAQAVRGWTWDDWAPCAAAYLDFVTFLDDCVGVVLDGLEATGRASETTVVFIADHGECLAAHNLYQKGVPYEESSAVPFLLRAPGISPGQRSELVSQVDLAPTLLELLGQSPLPETQGRSLVPLLHHARGWDRDALLVEFNGYILGGYRWRCAVSEQHKYTWFADGSELLFDLSADPAELNDLSADPAYDAVRSSLRDALARWMRETGDFLAPGDL